MDNVMGQIATVATAIIGVALLAVLVSRNSQTPQVITAAGKAFSDSLNAATSPVRGSSFGMTPTLQQI